MKESLISIYEYGIFNWLVDYHFVATIATLVIINIRLWGKEVIRDVLEAYYN